jgi:4-alpha-glucanotransferase
MTEAARLRQNAESAQRFRDGRHAGVLVPLFSMPSASSWGIGEIADIPKLDRWLQMAGLDFVQLLPVNEMEEGQNSPYSAMSAMAIDPIFIAMDAVEDFVAAGGRGTLNPVDLDALDRVGRSRTIDHDNVRRIKRHALRTSFVRFVAEQHGTGSARARRFEEFREQEGWWLADYVLFRTLHDAHGGTYWRDWDAPLRDRDPGALSEARRRLATPILYYEYVQWLAHEQWHLAREMSHAGIFGDFPFMVSAHSADVWARQHEFRLDASVGVPPDAFSETGQNWGLPVYRWDVIARDDYEWLRQRARRCVELYDGFRIDHLVGFYRTFVRERDDSTQFVPPDEPSQRAQGERILTLFRDSGARIFAEDLGVIPEFVRHSLAGLRIPGLKVLRWEREWNEPGQPFRDPTRFAADSVATTGTHDTETLAGWWDQADEEERGAALLAMGATTIDAGVAFGPVPRDALLVQLFLAGSDFVIVPIQDVFGWRDRVNVPAVVSADNWSWRLPWPVEDLTREADARDRATFLRALSERTGRIGR